jgi:hypothetical protein
MSHSPDAVKRLSAMSKPILIRAARAASDHCLDSMPREQVRFVPERLR